MRFCFSKALNRYDKSIEFIFPGKSTGVGCHFLLQRIFPTQESNQGLPHCRQILYCLSHKGSPYRIHSKYQKDPPSMGFSRQEYCSGLQFPSQGDLPDTGIGPRSPTLQADSLPYEPPGNPKYVWQECRIHRKSQKEPNNHRNVVQLTSLETLFQLCLAFMQLVFFNIFLFLVFWFKHSNKHTWMREHAHTFMNTHIHKPTEGEKKRNEERLRQGGEKLTYFFSRPYWNI